MKLTCPLLIMLLILSYSSLGQSKLQFDGVLGVVDCYSNFSSGTYSILELAKIAQRRDIDFLIVTDNLEDIDLTELEYSSIGTRPVDSINYERIVTKQSGIKAYIQSCRNATRETGVLVVPGIKINLNIDRDLVYDTDNKQLCLLGIGMITPEISVLQSFLGHNQKTIYSEQQKSLPLDIAQDTVAGVLHNQFGLAVVVAHPYVPDSFDGVYSYLAKERMSYIDGIEFFNSDDSIDSGAVRAMGFVDRGDEAEPYKDFAVVSGCNFHGISGVDSEEQFDYITVLATELPDYSTDEGYADACQAIANAIRGNSTIIAGIRRDFEEIGKTESTPYFALYQNGEMILEGTGLLIDPEFIISPAAAIYLHIPRKGILRFRPSPELEVP